MTHMPRIGSMKQLMPCGITVGLWNVDKNHWVTQRRFQELVERHLATCAGCEKARQQRPHLVDR